MVDIVSSVLVLLIVRLLSVLYLLLVAWREPVNIYQYITGTRYPDTTLVFPRAGTVDTEGIY